MDSESDDGSECEEARRGERVSNKCYEWPNAANGSKKVEYGFVEIITVLTVQLQCILQKPFVYFKSPCSFELGVVGQVNKVNKHMESNAPKAT